MERSWLLVSMLVILGNHLIPSIEGDVTLDQLLLLYDRPAEPIFLPKSNSTGASAVLDVPQEYLGERYKDMDILAITSFGSNTVTHIPVRRMSELPDISAPAKLHRRAQFSLFLPDHRRLAARLIELFMSMETLEDFMSAATYAKSQVNPYLFVYAFSVAILHRDDTVNAKMPSVAEIFPDKFVDGAVFSRAREEASTVLDSSKRIPLEIPLDYTASNLEDEHRVAYFREDLGVNLHHWHWHLVYPFDGPLSIVKKDRRGELFYYVHSQINARYDMERFSNRLQRVKRLVNLREPIAEGYFPKLDSLVASRVWPARVANTYLSDISRESDQIQFDIQDLERWRDRIFEAIHTGSIIGPDGTRVPLTQDEGIDVLGNIVESSVLSLNRPLYGDMHNFGHIAIAFAHDPDNRHLVRKLEALSESFGVMGDSGTAMRDPVFYRWHAFVADIFQEYKRTLPPYTMDQLSFPGIRVTSLEVQTVGGRTKRNELNTFWQQNDLDMSRGLDFTPRGPILARFTHLQHRAFSYKIQIENNAKGQKEGYVRIFMAPKYDERGIPMQFRDQRNFMVEMDKFPVLLRSRNNKVERKSTKSSVTIPFERTFRTLVTNTPPVGEDRDEYNFCGCGWPQHMLLPKGTPEGMAFTLFVMITDFTQDQVDQPLKGMCNDAASYCGVRGTKFPDRKPMGFPFDRSPRSGVDSLASFLTPNMFMQDIIIRFTDRMEAPAPNMNTSFFIAGTENRASMRIKSVVT